MNARLAIALAVAACVFALVVVVLSGCASGTDRDIDRAFKLCWPHGIKSFDNDTGHSGFIAECRKPR